jgi:hypothetical protein
VAAVYLRRHEPTLENLSHTLQQITLQRNKVLRVLQALHLVLPEHVPKLQNFSHGENGGERYEHTEERCKVFATELLTCMYACQAKVGTLLCYLTYNG